MSDNGSEIGAFMAGFVVGGLVGAATALILAPQSGSETRAQIAAKGDEWRQYGEEQLQEYRQYAGSAAADVQERARIVLDEGRSRVSGADDQEAESAPEPAADVTIDQEEEGDAAE